MEFVTRVRDASRSSKEGWDVLVNGYHGCMVAACRPCALSALPTRPTRRTSLIQAPKPKLSGTKVKSRHSRSRFPRVDNLESPCGQTDSPCGQFPFLMRPVTHVGVKTHHY